MNDEELRAKVLATLGLADRPKAEQDTFLYRVESIAQQRMGQAIPELLTPEQLQQVDLMQRRGDDMDAILDWVEAQVPHYQELIRALILDVAEESAAWGADFKD